MHIVILAWLYVTFAMALAMSGVVTGAAFFAGVGIAPILLVWAVVVRRVRNRRTDARRVGRAEPRSRAEDAVHRRDHTEAEPDR